MEGLLAALDSWDLLRKRVWVQLYGEPNPAFLESLESRGARLKTILLYTYLPPSKEELESFLSEIFLGLFDAVFFTSPPQVRNLFDGAETLGKKDDLLNAFRFKTRAVSIGRLTTQALKDRGISRIVQPKQERMGAMVQALAQSYLREGLGEEP